MQTKDEVFLTQESWEKFFRDLDFFQEFTELSSIIIQPFYFELMNQDNSIFTLCLNYSMKNLSHIISI